MILYQNDPQLEGGGMTLDEAFDVLGEVLESTRYQRELDAQLADYAKKQDKIEALNKKADLLDSVRPHAGDSTRKKAYDLGVEANKKSPSLAALTRRSQIVDTKAYARKRSNDDRRECAAGNKDILKRMYDAYPAEEDQPGYYLDLQKKIKALNASTDMIREACVTILNALDEGWMKKYDETQQKKMDSLNQDAIDKKLDNAEDLNNYMYGHQRKLPLKGPKGSKYDILKRGYDLHSELKARSDKRTLAHQLGLDQQKEDIIGNRKPGRFAKPESK